MGQFLDEPDLKIPEAEARVAQARQAMLATGDRVKSLESRMPRGQFLDEPAKDTRSGVTRLYQDYLAKPVTKLASKALFDPLTEPLVAGARVAGGEPLGQVASSYFPMTPDAVRGNRAVEAATPTNPLAELAVPQTPMQAGAMAGTMGAGAAVRGLRPGLQALSRITGGAVGGEVGGQAEGATTGSGAAVGGGGAAAGEGVGALMGRLRLAIPGGKRAANNADAARIGQTVEDIVPELSGVRTTPQIRNMTEGGGVAALGQAKEGTTRAVEGALEGRSIQVPSLGPRPGSVTSSPSYPLREANAGLTGVGEGAFNQNILDRTAKKAADRRLYGNVSREMEEGVARQGGEEATHAFAAGQDAYSSGSKILDFFKKSGVVDNDGFLNVPRMQRMLNNPKNAATLQRALGPEDFQTLSDAIYRGAPRGETDRLASGMGGSLDALSQVLRGSNTGFSQSWRVPLATVLPNIGSKYVGQNPLALPPALRAILDVGGQRAAGAGMDQP